MSSSSSSFKESYQMTLEESEAKVRRLQDAIDISVTMKNFERSAQLQAMLDKHMVIHNKLLEIDGDAIAEEKINDLERIKLEHESEILRSLINQMHVIYNSYDRDYADLEKRHKETIAQLENMFSQPKYTSIPLSSNLRALQRAESFYAKNKDFRAAAAIRNQIRQQSNREMIEFKQQTSNTIDAKIRDAVTRYQTEQKCFADRLQNEKNILKKETLKTIIALDNRFKKLLKQNTGRIDHDFGLMTEFKETVFNSIDNEFREFAKNLQTQYNAPKLSTGDSREVAEPRPIQTAPFSARSSISNTSSSRAPRRYINQRSVAIRNSDDPIQATIERRNRAFDISQPLSR